MGCHWCTNESDAEFLLRMIGYSETTGSILSNLKYGLRNQFIFQNDILLAENLPTSDLHTFYTSRARHVQLNHHALPRYLYNDIEQIQERYLSTILPSLPCCEARLVAASIPKLFGRDSIQCNSVYGIWAS